MNILHPPVLAVDLAVQTFHDPQTGTFTYLVYSKRSRAALLIDPVLDCDPVSKAISTENFNQIDSVIQNLGLHLQYVMETHVHADHLSASDLYKERHGASTLIGARVNEVLRLFDGDLPARTFDHYLVEGDELDLAGSKVKVIETPGHTPTCLSFLIAESCLFVGDCLLMPDLGTARCDFPGGDPAILYASIQKLYRLPDVIGVYVGHDYGTAKRLPCGVTTLGDQKNYNVMISANTPETEFVLRRKTRDVQLKPPALYEIAVRGNLLRV